MRRFLPLLGLCMLPACRPAATHADIIRAEERRFFTAYVARLEGQSTAQGDAFPADSLARLGASYAFCCGYQGMKVDTSKGLPMLRAAMARGSRDAPLYLAWYTRDSLAQRALFRRALRRGNTQAAAWLAIPFGRADRPVHADSLVLLAREARRYGATEAARSIERQLAALDSMANLGHPQADSLRRDLKQKGLWEDRFSVS